MKIDAFVLTFLLNALWQVPAVVVVGLLGSRLLHRSAARWRHTLWLAVAALCLMLPAVSLVRFEGPVSAPNTQEPDTDRVTDGGADWMGWLPEGPRPARVSPSAGGAALAVYGFLLLLRAAQLARSWSRARALARRARPLDVPEAAAPLVRRCEKALGARADLHSSAEVSGPVTLGALRPVILLPPGFLDGASPDEAVSALGHELAHVRRRDYAVNFLCEALLLPVAFHPAVRLVRRRLAEAREMACDEAALESLIGRRAYARSLLSLAAAAAGMGRPITTLGVADADTLEVRMKRILDFGPRTDVRRSRALLGTALLLLAAAGAAAAAFAMEAVAAGSGDLKPFVGSWSGDWPFGPDSTGRALRALDIEVRPNGEIVETRYRYRQTEEGPRLIDKVARPVSSYKVAGNTLTLKVQIDDFEPPNGLPVAVEQEGALELQGRDTALFKHLRHSYFEAAKKRGEAVPPPPPPIAMKRQA